MALEANPHQIEILALVPICGWPDGSDGVDDRITSAETHLQAHPFISIERKQVVIDFEPRFEGEAIERADIGKKGKMERGICGEKCGGAQKVLARHDDRGFAPKFNHLSDCLRVPSPELMHYWYFVRFL